VKVSEAPPTNDFALMVVADRLRTNESRPSLVPTDRLGGELPLIQNSRNAVVPTGDVRL
jgi:hypothetical protein